MEPYPLTATILSDENKQANFQAIFGSHLRVAQEEQPEQATRKSPQGIEFKFVRFFVPSVWFSGPFVVFQVLNNAQGLNRTN